MSAAVPPICDFGWQAPDFRLPGTDGRSYTLSDISGPKGTVVMFICNHCPFVIAIADRLVTDMKELMDDGIGVVAICANDEQNYPEDSFQNMIKFAKAKGLPFPYLQDESQSVARAYDAICTPDFFGFNAENQLQYRGRLDEGRTAPPPAGYARELVQAMKQIAVTGEGPRDQLSSMGCSIKWKAA